MKYRIVDDVQTGETASEVDDVHHFNIEVDPNVKSVELRLDEREREREVLKKAIELGVTTSEVAHYEENCVDSECEVHKGSQVPDTHEILSGFVEAINDELNDFNGEVHVSGVEESSDSPELTFSEGEVPCALLTGCAGSGKSWTIRRLQEADPSWGLVVSTTGISAINLDTITINSLLGYFDSDSMEDAWVTGRINRKLREVAGQFETLVVDEVSMMSSRQLDILYRAMAEFNEQGDSPNGADFDTDEDRPVSGSGRKNQLRLLVVGDLAQLPPIPDKDPKTGKSGEVPWCFTADCWPQFESHMTKLTKVWRQSDPEFIGAMNALRVGDGAKAVELLQRCGVQFHSEIEDEFDGTTIVPKNDQVDRVNQLAQMRVKGSKIQNRVNRRGLQRGEWVKQIPSWQEFKTGSYVMLLANQYTFDKSLICANGDCGHIKEWDSETRTATVELVRNGRLVKCAPITRDNTQKQKPTESDLKWAKGNKNWVGGEVPGVAGAPSVKWEPYKNDRDRWVMGSVEYLPMRLAYASTIHKTQSLSLDRVQIDCRPSFAGNPGMMYVAFSRCKTPDGLRIVGTPELLIRRANADPKIKPYL